MMWDHEALQSVDCFEQFLESFVLLSFPDDKGLEEHQKCTYNGHESILFFSASFSSYTFFPEKGKLPVYAPPCVEVKT